jgi:hypothetical protein
MTRIDDTQPHRGIEFGIFEKSPGEWEWTYHPKIGQGVATRGDVKGDRQAAIAACKTAIDNWLGPATGGAQIITARRRGRR